MLSHKKEELFEMHKEKINKRGDHRKTFVRDKVPTFAQFLASISHPNWSFIYT